MSDSAARDTSHDKSGKKSSQEQARDQTSKLIESALSNGELNNTFDDVTNRLVKRLESFSKELSVDYHIVLTSDKLNARYSIIEGKNPNYAYKELDFGIVGSLLKQRRSKYQSLFVQFKFSSEFPVVAYSESENQKIEKLSSIMVTKLLGKDNDPVWNSQKKDFAIAASLIKDKNGKPIGACSIDFSTNGLFPDFSFRKDEVEEVFDILYTFKLIFEKLIYMDSSESSIIESSMKNVIDIIRGSESDEQY